MEKISKVRKKFIRKKENSKNIPSCFVKKEKKIPPPETHMLYKIQVFITTLFFENGCCYFFYQEIGFISVIICINFLKLWDPNISEISISQKK